MSPRHAQHLLSLGWCRTTVNRRISQIKLAFSWSVEEELIPPSIAHGLREVKGIRKGDKNAREAEPVQPAFEEDVVKVLPFCSRPVAAMLELQWLCGMRSGEVRIMRTADIDRKNPDCWLYVPTTHKNAWRGQDRTGQNVDVRQLRRCVQKHSSNSAQLRHVHAAVKY